LAALSDDARRSDPTTGHDRGSPSVVLVDESVAAVGFQRDVGRGPAGLRGEVFGHVGIGAALLAPSSARSTLGFRYLIGGWSAERILFAGSDHRRQLMDQDRAAQTATRSLRRLARCDVAWRANRVAEVRSPPARYVIASDRRASPSPRRLPARR
jgi:hypothetical protein